MQRPLTLAKLLAALALAPVVLAPTALAAEISPAALAGVVIDLKEPLLEDGVLYTEEGGVITTDLLRVQAQKIRYTKREEEGRLVWTLWAEGNLMLEYKHRVLVGDSLEYDFITRTGTLENGRAEVPPWFVGGRLIHLLSDGSFEITDGYLTTSERLENEWQIYTPHLTIRKGQSINITDLQVRLASVPIAWFPTVKTSLSSVTDNPLQFRAKFAGAATRVGARYRLYEGSKWALFARADYFLRRGFGGGLETSYESADFNESLYTSSYVAYDQSVDNDEDPKRRFRFNGIYNNSLHHDKLTLRAQYDRLSDSEMAHAYYNRDFDLETAMRTAIAVRLEEPDWLALFLTQVHINGFQTINQSLPSLLGTMRTVELGKTGILGDNKMRASYQSYVYATGSNNVSDFSSSRFEGNTQWYRPTHLGPLVVTPQVGATGVFYSASQEQETAWMGIGTAKIEALIPLNKTYTHVRHVAEPFATYQLFTAPQKPLDSHYVFDLSDGLAKLQMTTLGLRNRLYTLHEPRTYLTCDIWTHAFFDKNTFATTFPKGYTHLAWHPLATLENTYDIAWNFEHDTLEYFNTSLGWTLSEDTALGVEYRHRSAYDWRKADHESFFLDVARSETLLLASPLSDRRDVILTRLFYRFTPFITMKLQSRHGWNRKDQPPFNEYQAELWLLLKSRWRLRLSYEHLESNDSVSLSLRMGEGNPSRPANLPVW